MFVGVVAYAIFAGADFGTGVWDLTAGDARAGRPDAGADRRLDRAGVGGQPRLADLRAGVPVDGFPARHLRRS